MADFFGGLLKGIFGQQDIPDLKRFSGQSVLSDVGALAPQLASANIDYQRRLGVPLAQISRDVENVYDPNQGRLRETTTKSILDDLNLGGSLPGDVESVVRTRALERGGAAGIGGSQAGRNLVARDLGLTSLDLRNQRLNRAAGYTRSAPDTFREQPFLSIPDLANIGIQGTGQANAIDTMNAQMESENNAAIINSLARIAGQVVAGVYGGGMGGAGAGIGGLFSGGQTNGSDNQALIMSLMNQANAGGNVRGTFGARYA